MQVEAGPQEGSVLLTWLPVTIDTSGFSNGALISGYVVYADGQKVKQVLGATSKYSNLFILHDKKCFHSSFYGFLVS